MKIQIVCHSFGAVVRAGAALLLVAIVPATFAEVTYSVTGLGTLGGGSSYAYGINNSGQVAGYSTTSFNQTHAFIYSGGSMTDLGTLFGSWSQAYAINDQGQVVGGSDGRAFLYSGGSMYNLGMLGTLNSTAYGINNNGQVVGTTSIPGGAYHGFIKGSGPMTDLGTLGTGSGANSINNNGQVVGGYITTSGAYGSYLYNGGTMRDLPNTFGGQNTFATAINESGQVVGYASTPNGAQHAFLYSGGSMIELGTLGDNEFSRAYDINNNGQMVGEGTSGASWHAILFDGQTVIDLNSLISQNSGWTLNHASGINDSGEITGWGTDPLGRTEAFLLTPIPEPATVSLLAFGAAVWFLIRAPEAIQRRVKR
jgi:probable HAF family extracellular repeat protein